MNKRNVKSKKAKQQQIVVGALAFIMFSSTVVTALISTGIIG